MINLMPTQFILWRRYLQLGCVLGLILWGAGGFFVVQRVSQLHQAIRQSQSGAIHVAKKNLVLSVDLKQLTAWQQAVKTRYQHLKNIWGVMQSVPQGVQLTQVNCRDVCDWVALSQAVEILKKMPGIEQVQAQESGWYRAKFRRSW